MAKNKYSLNFPLIFKRAIKRANKDIRYTKSDYLNELRESKGININIRTLTNMNKSLPYSITVLKAMAEKSGLTIEEIIKNK